MTAVETALIPPMTILLTTDPIDYSPFVEATRAPASGAVVLFLGTVRELSEGRPVAFLEYETYPSMAEKKLAAVVSEAEKRWPLNAVGVIHRYGRLELGDIAVAVVAASGHRAEAFAAAQWIMDTIKEVVPIWKKEIWADGSSEWVHPDSGAVDAARKTND